MVVSFWIQSRDSVPAIARSRATVTSVHKTRGKRTTLSHSSLARDSDIGPWARRPISDVLMQGHNEGEFRLRNAGRF